MKRWSALAAVLLAFVAALAFRLPELSLRPFHNDEAVNANKVTGLWKTGRYAYDPDEYHGPTLHYFTLPFLWLSGAHDAGEVKDSTLRLPTVFFGAGLILLLLLFKDGLNCGSICWSAAFLAVSPAMVFYSRYFIHEMLLVFFSALLIGALWRYHQSKSAAWAILAGASVGLMYATKETFVLTIVAIVFAAFGTHIVGRARRSVPAADMQKDVPIPNALANTFTPLHIALALGAALLMWLVFFSSFFTNFQGPADSIRTYLPWLKRAGGHSPHIHPWYFYLQRLVWFHPAKSPIWSEALIAALGIVGAIVSLKRRSPFPIFLAIYTIVLTILYSAISYKTPWCLLNFWLGAILLAGIGASSLISSISIRPLKFAAVAAILILTAQLGSQSVRGNFRSAPNGALYAADSRNPYVYAQTAPDLLNLASKAEAIARIAPQGHDTVIKVIASNGDYWPLPWYLRRFKNIGWYEKIPADPFAPMIIVAANLDARLDDKSDKKWIMVGYTELRPQKFLELYVESELWKKYVASLPPQSD
jgi:uncharacterized protein (TIGR03663 family)